MCESLIDLVTRLWQCDNHAAYYIVVRSGMRWYEMKYEWEILSSDSAQYISCRWSVAEWSNDGVNGLSLNVAIDGHVPICTSVTSSGSGWVISIIAFYISSLSLSDM